jgi:uracil-DNA glycosylase
MGRFFLYKDQMIQTKDLKCWPKEVRSEMQKNYFQDLTAFLDKEKSSGATVFPEDKNIFKAFKTVPYEKVKVVILGQDPYHKKDQAHGLSFSVPNGVKRPPSLMNIYKELNAVELRPEGSLDDWAEQGVFLLNTVLTVREGEAASHQNRGWELFTDAVLRSLNKSELPVVFMLWGAQARKKASFLDNDKHLVLEAPHPSPLSAYRGFLGCGHFEIANKHLRDNGLKPIKWV